MQVQQTRSENYKHRYMPKTYMTVGVSALFQHMEGWSADNVKTEKHKNGTPI
jgi:hypothetical protein